MHSRPKTRVHLRPALALLACAVLGTWGTTPATAADELLIVESPLTVSGIDGIATQLTLDPNAYETLKSAETVLLTSFPLCYARFVDLILDRIEVFAHDAVILIGNTPAQRPDIVVLSGAVIGEPGSTVVLGLSPHGNNGYIEVGKELYIVSSGSRPENRETVVYNMTTLPPGTITWSDWQCYSEGMLVPGALLWAQVNERRNDGNLRDGACRVAEIALETDYEFTQDLFGGDTDAAEAYTAVLVGALTDIYQRDINVRVEIVFLRLWTDSNDPWNQGDTINQLYQFQDYWNANMTHVQRHVAHFLSGRGLGGGVAYLPGLCYPEYDYALSANLAGYFPYPLEDNHSQNWDIFVFAHENGHIFGGPHTHGMDPPIDGCAWGDCSVTPHGTIMSYCHGCPGGMTNIELRFHDRMINEAILPHLDNGAPCDLRVDPVTITDDPESQSACPGDSVTFNVIAEGEPPLEYQWRKDGADIPGATDSSYAIEEVTHDDAGVYDVIVTNTCGAAESDFATLTVEDCCPGDLDGDGQTGQPDLGILLSDWGCTGDGCVGDIDGDGETGQSDLGLLLSDWNCGI